MSPPLTAADITFMTSERIAEIVAASLAVLDRAQAQRLGGEG